MKKKYEDDERIVQLQKRRYNPRKEREKRKRMRKNKLTYKVVRKENDVLKEKDEKRSNIEKGENEEGLI